MESWEKLARIRQEDSIIFIGCGKKKSQCKTQAKYLYQGSYFKLCLTLARLLTKEKNIFILSAKYGLLALDTIISPYELKLSSLNKEDISIWRSQVQKQIKKLPVKNKYFICSKLYYKGIKGKAILPSMGIGLQMKWLKENIIKVKGILHVSSYEKN